MTSPRDEVDRFTLTPEMVKLLRETWITWSPMEWGAPTVDPKRPFGNGDIHEDMARILGETARCPHCDEFILSDNEKARLDALYASLEAALQIVLVTGSFEPGEYVKPKYGRAWRRAK